MKKLSIPALLLILLLSHPFEARATDICLEDTLGTYFVLNGGKVDVKPFAGKVVNQFCHGTISASIVTLAPGVETVTIQGSAQPPCTNFILIADLDASYNGWSAIDLNEDGSLDGNLFLTKVSCDTVQGL